MALAPVIRQILPHRASIGASKHGRLAQFLRSLATGGVATFADLVVIVLAVGAFGISASAANVPALLVGAIVQFFGNRHFAFVSVHDSADSFDRSAKTDHEKKAGETGGLARFLKRKPRDALWARRLLKRHAESTTRNGRMCRSRRIFREQHAPNVMGSSSGRGERILAFRADRESMGRQAVLFAASEGVGLALNAVVYGAIAAHVSLTAASAVVVRIVTTAVIFACWSYPVWRRVFRAPQLSHGESI